MEVKPGYKQTEVGVIPEDWEVKTLSELTSQIIDGTHHTPRYTPFGVPFLRVTDIQESEINLADVRFISHSEHQILKRRCNPEKGDLLLSKNGTIGIPKIVSWDWEFSVFVSLALLKLRSKFISATFLEHFFKSSFLAEQIRQRSKQGTVTNLHLEEIREFFIPLPPTKVEQDTIAEVLSDVDALLGALDRLIAKKRDLKQAAMKQLLTGQTRLPGFRGEWEVKRIANIAPLQRGFDLPNPDLRPGPYPVVYSNGIMNYHAKAQVQGPGVVTGRSGTIGNVTFVDGPFWPHNTALWVTSFKGNSPRFVFHLYTKIDFERFATGSGVPTLNRNDVHSFEVAIPPTTAEQTAIAAVLTEVDAELVVLEQRQAKTRALKQGMMQELLTGKTRLV